MVKLKEENYSEYKLWKEAMLREEENMEEQQVYEEIYNQIPKDSKGIIPRYIDSTWAFAKQYDEEGKLLKYKARLCGRGFREIEGIDYEEE